MRLLVIAIVMSGCAASGLPDGFPDPMTIVWQDTYAMDAASAPSVSWFSECRQNPRTPDERAVIQTGACVDAVIYDGVIEVRRLSGEKISDTPFSRALLESKRTLLKTTSYPIDQQAIADANTNLIAFGF